MDRLRLPCYGDIVTCGRSQMRLPIVRLNHSSGRSAAFATDSEIPLFLADWLVVWARELFRAIQIVLCDGVRRALEAGTRSLMAMESGALRT